MTENPAPCGSASGFIKTSMRCRRNGTMIRHVSTGAAVAAVISGQRRPGIFPIVMHLSRDALPERSGGPWHATTDAGHHLGPVAVCRALWPEPTGVPQNRPAPALGQPDVFTRFLRPTPDPAWAATSIPLVGDPEQPPGMLGPATHDSPQPTGPEPVAKRRHREVRRRTAYGCRRLVVAPWLLGCSLPGADSPGRLRVPKSTSTLVTGSLTASTESCRLQCLHTRHIVGDH